MLNPNPKGTVALVATPNPIIIGSLFGLSAKQMSDVLTPAAVGVCGWLDSSCTEPAADGDWLCTPHRKQVMWRPTAVTR